MNNNNNSMNNNNVIVDLDLIEGEETKTRTKSQSQSHSYDVGEKITEVISTRYGVISCTYTKLRHEGQNKFKPLITYHDCFTNSRTCFSSFFRSAGSEAEIVKKFCVYEIDCPGSQDGSVHGCPEEMYPMSLDKLAEQIEDVVTYFGLQRREVFALAVGSGATVMSIYANRFASPICGMILVSPMSRQASYLEWMFAKAFRLRCRGRKTVSDSQANHMMERLFSKASTDGFAGKFSSDLALGHRNELQAMRLDALLAYYDATVNRLDNTHIVSSLKCRTLILAGSSSPWYNDSLHMNSVMDKTITSWVDMEKIGAACTMENPAALLSPIHLWIQRLKSEGYV
jgi:protein NDRG1